MWWEQAGGWKDLIMSIAVDLNKVVSIFSSLFMSVFSVLGMWLHPWAGPTTSWSHLSSPVIMFSDCAKWDGASPSQSCMRRLVEWLCFLTKPSCRTIQVRNSFLFADLWFFRLHWGPHCSQSSKAKFNLVHETAMETRWRKVVLDDFRDLQRFFVWKKLDNEWF